MFEAGVWSAHAHADSKRLTLVFFDQEILDPPHGRINGLLVEASVQRHAADRFEVIVEARKDVDMQTSAHRIAQAKLVFRITPVSGKLDLS